MSLKAKWQYNSAIAASTTAQTNINFEAYLWQEKPLLNAEVNYPLNPCFPLIYLPIIRSIVHVFDDI